MITKTLTVSEHMTKYTANIYKDNVLIEQRTFRYLVDAYHFLKYWK